MIQELSNGGKHYMALKKAVEMTTQKKVETTQITRSAVTFYFEDGDRYVVLMKDFNLFELYNTLLKGW